MCCLRARLQIGTHSARGKTPGALSLQGPLCAAPVAYPRLIPKGGQPGPSARVHQALVLFVFYARLVVFKIREVKSDLIRLTKTSFAANEL